MNFLSFGAGAIGTYIGGSLAINGQQVVFLERPEVAVEVYNRGLRLRLDGVERIVPDPKIAGSLAEALAFGPFDAALFALKSFDTAAALHELVPFQEAIPPILCLQNGVENEAAIATALGSERVIAGTVTSAIGRRGPGDIVLERLRGMGVAAGHSLSPSLSAALDGAGLNSRLFSKAGDMKWSKLLTNLLANASSAILDMSPAEIFNHPGLFQLEVRQLREALRVMAVQQINVVNLPGTPVRLLALGVQRLPLAIARPILRRAVGSGRGGKMPSFHIDLHSGRGRSEVDYLNGAVVRLGERFGVQTPVNCLLNETLLALTEKKLPLEAFHRKPEALLEKLQPGYEKRPK